MTNIKGNRTMANKVAQNTGLSVNACRLFIKVLSNIVIRDLQDTHEVQVENLGTFTVGGKNNKRVLFRPAQKFLLDVISSTKKKIQVTWKSDPMLLEESKEIVDELLDVIDRDIILPARLVQSFTAYLKEGFPSEGDWKVPAKGIIYTYGQVKTAIETYRDLDPYNYVVLWSIWVSVEARQALVDARGLTIEKLIFCWHRAINSILFLLEHKDLMPPKLRTSIAKRDIPVRVRRATRTEIQETNRDKYLAPFKKE